MIRFLFARIDGGIFQCERKHDAKYASDESDDDEFGVHHISRPMLGHSSAKRIFLIGGNTEVQVGEFAIIWAGDDDGKDDSTVLQRFWVGQIKEIDMDARMLQVHWYNGREFGEYKMAWCDNDDNSGKMHFVGPVAMASVLFYFRALTSHRLPTDLVHCLRQHLADVQNSID